MTLKIIFYNKVPICATSLYLLRCTMLRLTRSTLKYRKLGNYDPNRKVKISETPKTHEISQKPREKLRALNYLDPSRSRLPLNIDLFEHQQLTKSTSFQKLSSEFKGAEDFMVYFLYAYVAILAWSSILILKAVFADGENRDSIITFMEIQRAYEKKIIEILNKAWQNQGNLQKLFAV